jgi:uncharacterized protein
MNLPLTQPAVTLSPLDGERDELRSALSRAARQRIVSRRGEPLFIADWESILMIHFEVDAGALQREVPFQLDLHNGRAFVSLVAFTMRGMRPRVGGQLAAWLFRPIATHHFLNVRTYVRHRSETGIHFLAEWLSNWVAVQLGPATFSLPYRHGHIAYDHHWRRGQLSGRVEDVAAGAALEYEARLEQLREKALREEADYASIFAPCEFSSLTEWLMERYTAFNCAHGRKKFFHIWHPPWLQSPIEITIQNDSLITLTWPWFKDAQLLGANFSPGLVGVWMGWPQRMVA